MEHVFFSLSPALGRLSLLRANSEIQNLDGLILGLVCLSLFKKKTPRHGRRTTLNGTKYFVNLWQILTMFHILAKYKYKYK